MVTLTHPDGWDSGPLTLAHTRRRRRRGLIPGPAPVGLLLRTRSVHGWGLVAPLRWVGLDVVGRVTATGVLRPRGVVVAPHPTTWIAEMPQWLPTPPVGDPVRVVPILAVWPDD